MNNKNEKIIYASFFEEKVQDGPVRFLVTDAKYNVFQSKNSGKDFEVVKITVEVEELNNPDSEKEIKDVNIFMDHKPGGFFHQFVTAVLEGTHTIAFSPSKIIGLRGEAKLHHYRPEGSEFVYPRMNDWIFYAPSEKVEEALAKYVDDDLEDVMGDIEND